MASGVLSHGLVLLFGASKFNPSNNKVKGGVSAIGGHRLVKKYNNEQKDGVFSGGGYRRGRATWAERVGVHFGIVWGGKWGNEKRREMNWASALSGCP